VFSARRPLATLAVVAGLLGAAAPASAGTFVGNPGDPPARTSTVICAFPDVCKTAVLYNGHAGLATPDA
jgi:hypothetical protein